MRAAGAKNIAGRLVRSIDIALRVSPPRRASMLRISTRRPSRKGRARLIGDSAALARTHDISTESTMCLAVIGPLISAFGSIAAGMQAKRDAEYQAAILERNARHADQMAAAEAERFRLKADPME